jgi:hypothetical protein
MKYIIILVIAAVVGYYLYKRRVFSEAEIDSIKETYVCDKCGENFCECHKEEAEH